jgi:DNA repair exonuclease SbcCD ATPase subunit
MDPQDLQEVRKIIEKSTSKVSLRDLEKKGFRKVKVLRSNDIDDLIRRAVHAVVAREGVASAESEEIVKKSKEELRSLMAAAQAAEQERAELAAQNQALEEQIRELRSRVQQRADLEGKLKELQRRLADEEEARRRAESQLRDLDALKRRAEEAEARALAYQSLREEADELRSRLKHVETEHRLTHELEVPKLRERIEGLEAELRAARAAAAALPQAQDMRAMFRELLAEVGAGRASGVDPAIREEFAKMQKAIAESLARAGGRAPAEVTEADLEAVKLSIAQIFAADAARTGVETNIAAVEVKETTAVSNVKDNLNKLKSLRKGGSS